MKPMLIARWVMLLVATLLCLGCAHAYWHVLEKVPGHRIPERVQIYVAISEEVARSDDGGSVAALIEAMDAELRQRGHRVVITGAHPEEQPPLPRVEIQVLSADWGNRQMRGAGALAGYAVAPAGMALGLAGSGSLLVDCYVVQADSQVTFKGRVGAGTFGSDSAGYDTVGAERAGRSLARVIAEPLHSD